MAEDRIQFNLQAPDKAVADLVVDRVVAPGVEGELGVLPGHVDLVTCLEPGVVRVVDENEEGEEPIEHRFVVHGGFLEIRDNAVSVLADVTENVTDLDMARAEAARKRAEERLAAKSKDIDLTRAEFSLKRALIRLNAAGGTE